MAIAKDKKRQWESIKFPSINTLIVRGRTAKASDCQDFTLFSGEKNVVIGDAARVGNLACSVRKSMHEKLIWSPDHKLCKISEKCNLCQFLLRLY